MFTIYVWIYQDETWVRHAKVETQEQVDKIILDLEEQGYDREHDIRVEKGE